MPAGPVPGRRGGGLPGGDAGAATVEQVRLTEFWTRMESLLGTTYADSYARDQVLATLGGRTVHQALAEGDDTKRIWRAVLAAQEAARSG